MLSPIRRRLAGSADSLGGIERSRQSAIPEMRKVAASKAYADHTPKAAISSPPSAGPRMLPTCQRNEFRAPAAASSSWATTRGMIASSDGRCRPSTAANTIATR